MIKTTRLLLLCVALLPTFALADQNGFTLANNYFGLNLLRQLSVENDQKPVPENLFFSPYSVSIAMAMLYQGAGGNTSKQFESSLGYEIAKLSDKNGLTQTVKQSNDAILDAENASYTLRSANALLTNPNIQILDSFKQNLNDNFKAELFSPDFTANPAAVQALVNEWCSNKTNGKIDKLLKGPPSLTTALALINAVYFKASWLHHFDPEQTKPDTFYGRNGAEYAKVQFMNEEAYYKTGNLDQFDSAIVELPYRGRDLSMFAILPIQKANDLSKLKSGLNASVIEQAIGQLKSTNIKLKFPKLEFKSDYDLIPSLKALGITDVFDGSKSDLTGISGTSGSVLSVGVVKHAGSIEVNEAGTEAAAASYISIEGSSPNQAEPPLFAFDHPFLFFIRHNQNGQILFVGEVNKF